MGLGGCWLNFKLILVHLAFAFRTAELARVQVDGLRNQRNRNGVGRFFVGLCRHPHRQILNRHLLGAALVFSSHPEFLYCFLHTTNLLLQFIELLGRAFLTSTFNYISQWVKSSVFKLFLIRNLIEFLQMLKDDSIKNILFKMRRIVKGCGILDSRCSDFLMNEVPKK